MRVLSLPVPLATTHLLVQRRALPVKMATTVTILVSLMLAQLARFALKVPRSDHCLELARLVTTVMKVFMKLRAPQEPTRCTLHPVFPSVRQCLQVTVLLRLTILQCNVPAVTTRINMVAISTVPPVRSVPLATHVLAAQAATSSALVREVLTTRSRV